MRLLAESGGAAVSMVRAIRLPQLERREDSLQELSACTTAEMERVYKTEKAELVTRLFQKQRRQIEWQRQR